MERVFRILGKVVSVPSILRVTGEDSAVAVAPIMVLVAAAVTLVVPVVKTLVVVPEPVAVVLTTVV